MDLGAAENLISRAFFATYAAKSYTLNPSPKIITLNEEPLTVYGAYNLYVRARDSNRIEYTRIVRFVIVKIPLNVILGYP